MGDKYEIILDKEVYAPGDVMKGRIECNFLSENKIKGIRVKLTGSGRVSWKVSRYSYCRAQEVYLDMNNELLSGEATVPPGYYNYPFTFTLPSTVPPSMSDGDPTYFRDVASFVVPIATIEVHYGAIEYNVQAIITRSWATNFEANKQFKICSSSDLNANDVLAKPLEINKAKRPTSLLFKENGPIAISVQLPMTGYVPTQVISFVVKLKNESTIDVQYIQFRFVQGFVFHAEQQSKSIDCTVGEEFVVKDSSVEAGQEKLWNLALKVPQLFLGNFNYSNIIKIFWELRGDVSLPFPHSSFSIHVPITLGKTPIRGS